jgi:DNA-binding CsgD family transcriptional regulator/tetratricopeptide (TPR) repeat protein
LLEVVLGPRAATEPVAVAHVHAAFLDLLRCAAAERPLAVVIEDVHWADRSTQDFLRTLARSLSDERLVIAATFRSDELTPVHPARALVAELIRCETVVQLRLERLTPEETAEQLAAIAGAPVPAAAVAEIHVRADGNPFLTEELWAAGGSVPATLQDALLARVRALPAEVQDVLRLLAVFGRPVGDELLGAAPLVRRAVDEHVLERQGERLGFRHALVREALYAELVPGERERMHHAALAALEGHSAGPAELAYHHLAAGQRAEALAALVEAGHADARRAAYPEALSHFERALELAPERIDLYRDAADAARLTGEYERAIEHCRSALERIDVARDPLRAAAFLERLSVYQSYDTDAALAAAERALALLGPKPSAERARALTGRSLQLGLRGRWAQARQSAEEALAIAVAVGARAEECSAAVELGIALAFDGDPSAGDRSLRRALTVAEELGAPEEVARAYVNLAELERLRGRTAAALDVLREGRARAEALGIGASWGAFMAVISADDLFGLGRWPELDAALQATREAKAGRAGAVMWPLVAGRLALARGQTESALAHLEQAWARALRGVTLEMLPHTGAALAELRLWQGDAEGARTYIDQTRRLTGDHEDVLNTPPLLCAGVRVEAALASRGRAAALLSHLEALVGSHPPPKALACREQARAEVTGDARAWESAIVAWEALADPYRTAHARLRCAEALLTERGGRARAAPALRRAHAEAGTLGAALLRGAIEALARRARIELHAPAPEPRPRRPHGLTRRETEVLALVADGLTNRQIAERLFITPKTAGLHVSRILAKLRVDSRLKAAAIVHRTEALR